MGVSQSKGGDGGGVRWKLRPLVPHSWVELEQLLLRFQQEAHRRRADPAFQYFMPFPVFQAIVASLCPHNDKTQMLAMFEALDVKQTRKLAVMDFFSGLALLVDAKKPQKLEFVLSLLDNGGLKTLNKCELAMVVSAAARGLKMFAPGADVLQESTMRPLIRRLFGDNDEVLRQTIVNKALADPEILFFMSDLDAGIATSSEELLVQQGKIMRHMAYLDYQALRVTVPDDTGRIASAVAPTSGSSKPIKGQRLMPPSAPTAESCVRKLQSIVCPPPAKGSNQSMRVLSTVEVKKYVDSRTLQRLIKLVSDGGISLSRDEAEVVVSEIGVDQFGLARCGDILRVMKAWAQNHRQEKPEATWEIVGNAIVEGVKTMEKRMHDALAAFGNRATRKLGPTARRRTTAAKGRLLESLQNVLQSADSDDGELQWTLSIQVGKKTPPVQVQTSSLTSKRVGALGVPVDSNIKFRLGIHPPQSGEGITRHKTNVGNEGQVEYESDDSRAEDSDIDTMRLTVSFLLNPEITDEEGIDLASAVEKAVQQDQVWSLFASLWTQCSVTMHSDIRNDGGIQPVMGKYLRVCIEFREDVISQVEECMRTSFAAGIRSVFVLGELNQSLSDIVKAAQTMATLLQSLGKRKNRERAMKMIFDAFDTDQTGEWSLQEFNTFLQAIGKEAFGEASLIEFSSGASTISFDKFLKMYENYQSARLLEMIRQLGIGSLGDIVKGSISITSTLNEPCLKALDVLLSPLHCADVSWKRLLAFIRSTKDFNLELQFSKLSELMEHFTGHAGIRNLVNDPLFVSSFVEQFKEFLQPPHAQHSQERPCRSIFCSLQHEMNKTEQQFEFDDHSKRLPRGTSARRAEGMVLFLKAAKLVKAHVQGPEVLEIRSKSIRIVCELDNVRVTPSKMNEDTDFC
ncbi:hypothetical protein V7S43_006351 [Phytophthora oleae]|uniref:EF-hand domain-containing protein n=1 Tax=Phytophthora oleae TaxID=2107226 RepID=A0ABD3FQV7_9STRA